jgi:Zn-dependent protease/predicted transcriptional regulator
MRAAPRLFTWRGIEFRTHWSLVVIASLLAWSLAGTAFPADASGYPTSVYWIAGVLAAVAFLASITAHELGHSIVAQNRGIRVRSITLWLFGGVAQLDRRPQTWREEMAVALAGPAVSIGIGFGSIAAALLVWSTTASGLATASLAWLGSTNVILAVFNMLPGAPLDGGRVFAAWRWRGHGSPVRARAEASRAGVVVAHGMIAVGVVLIFIGATVSGLWLAFLGWFLAGAARAEFDDIETRHVLDHVTVGEVMTTHPAMVPEAMTVDTLVSSVLPKIHGSTVPVVRDGRLKGLITPEHLRRVFPGDRRHCTTADIATPGDKVVTAKAGELLLDALDRIDRDEQRIVVIDDSSHVVGLITPTDLARILRVAHRNESLARV